MAKNLCFVLLSLMTVSLLCSAPAAQAEEEKTVYVVQVEGNQAISSSTILSKIKTNPGSAFSQEVIADDIKRLYALGYFTDVAIDADDYEDGIMVTIMVEEKPVVREVIFEGNKRIRTGRLKKAIHTKVGDMLDYSKLSDDVSEIKTVYESSGFHQATVAYELEKDETENQATVRIIIDEKARLRIKRVFVEGNYAVKTRMIRNLMATRPAWLFRRGYFDDEIFENDLQKIKAYYQDKGFLDVSVTPEFDFFEGIGIINITLKITEGQQYLVGDVTLGGTLVFPEEDVRKEITLKTGEPFSYAEIRKSVEAVRVLYYAKGYMNVVVSVDRVLDPGTQDVDVLFTIDAKDVVYVGTINIKGNSKTKDIVIRRELRIFPGEAFDGDKIRRSKERLYNLGFFEDIYFETVPTDEPNVSNLEISVKEAKTGEFSFGGGYSSVDEFVGFVQVVQKNFDILNFPYFTGDGQKLALRAEAGTVRRDFDLSWTEPWIFDYPLSFGFDAYHKTHLRRSDVGYGYEEVRTGGDLRLGKEFLEFFRTDLVYRLENVNISDVSDEATQDLRDEEGENWLSSLIWGVQFDNRDNIFSPTKGMLTGVSVENTGGFLQGDKDYIKTYFWSSYYFSPIRIIVIELKSRAGVVNNYGDTDKVPIYERFYAGGANTIRGYRERRVGPRDPSSSDPTGGEALLISNAELSFPIYQKVIKGAIFYDVGNVWADIRDFGQGGFKQGAGVGIRVKTPIGPIRIDWGYPLSDNQGDKKEGQFYFSVSHGF